MEVDLKAATDVLDESILEKEQEIVSPFSRLSWFLEKVGDLRAELI